MVRMARYKSWWLFAAAAVTAAAIIIGHFGAAGETEVTEI
jgi:hypothetical protein